MVAFFASRVASRKALLYSLLSRYMRNGLYLRRLMARPLVHSPLWLARTWIQRELLLLSRFGWSFSKYQFPVTEPGTICGDARHARQQIVKSFGRYADLLVV